MAAWESLFQGTQPTQKLLSAWARGLSLNTATPADLLPHLLDRSSYAVYRPMAAEVVDAMPAHPDWKRRASVAELQPNIT
ncbi:hypothetical protein [Streptomyces chartreusis]|uniref:hypothetical protein n=1 Tax=Streptomyces chartreusis TaxID=1969 RepID=UPI003418FFDF